MVMAQIIKANVCGITFLINFLFLNILAFLAPKNWNFGQKVILTFLVKIFKNKELIEKIRENIP